MAAALAATAGLVDIAGKAFLRRGACRFSREMAAARGLIGDPAQARRDSPDPGRRHDGRGHPAAIFGRRAGRAAA